MGKGTIQSNNEFLYSIKLIHDQGNLAAEKVENLGKIANLQAFIATLQPDDPKVAVAKIQIASLNKRNDYIDNYNVDDETVSAWCADRSDSLSGDIATCEIPNDKTIVQTRPGYTDSAVYNSVRDGQFQRSIAMNNPSGTYFNWALLPGWQKWRPTYRHGYITSINRINNTCDITLSNAQSIWQALDVNQTTTLEDVPIDYMACDQYAFEIDDYVLIEFLNNDWSDPLVIGFKDNPKKCIWENWRGVNVNSKNNWNGYISDGVSSVSKVPFDASILQLGSSYIKINSDTLEASGSGAVCEVSGVGVTATAAKVYIPIYAVTDGAGDDVYIEIRPPGSPTARYYIAYDGSTYAGTYEINLINLNVTNIIIVGSGNFIYNIDYIDIKTTTTG